MAQFDSRWKKFLSQANEFRNTFESLLDETIPAYRQKYSDFEEAYSSSVGQYGKDSVRLHDLFPLEGVLNPLVMVIGGNATIAYHPDTVTLTGDLGTCSLQTYGIYVIGRREPQDSKLIVWGPHEEVEIANYNPLFSVIPSRVHAAFLVTKDQGLFFTDLGSSSKSALIGENKILPFFVVYSQPKLELVEISLKAKYSK